MFKQNKFIKIGLLVGFLIVLIVVVNFFYRNNNKIILNQNNQGKNNLKSEIIEEKVIQSNGSGFSQFSLNKDKKYIIAVFPYTSDSGKILENPGFLFFSYGENGKVQKIEKVLTSFLCYECEMNFSTENGLIDLNNDGKKEVIVYTESLKLSGGYGIFIYNFIDNKLSPIFEEIGLDSDSDFKFIDIDQDKRIEISLLFSKVVRLGTGVNDIRTDTYKRIYKWDGTEKPYYLWKEEKVEVASP